MFSWLRKLTANSEGDRPDGAAGESRIPEPQVPEPQVPEDDSNRPDRPAVPIRPRESMRIRRETAGRSATSPSPAPPAAPPDPPSPPAKKQSSYHDLRKLALTASREEATGASPKGSMEPWAAIMEMAFAGATATVVAFENGTASVYVSSGGGFRGGGGEEKIREAAKAFIAKADQFIPQMVLTDAFPEPRLGEMIFYVRTDVGTFTAKVPKDELMKGWNVLSPLYRAAQDVITQYRLWSEAQGK